MLVFKTPKMRSGGINTQKFRLVFWLSPVFTANRKNNDIIGHVFGLVSILSRYAMSVAP